MIRRYLVLLMIFVAGCFSVQPAIQETATAERKISTSAETAFNEIATVATRCSELISALTSTVEAGRSPVNETLANISSVTHALANISTKTDNVLDLHVLVYVVIGGVSLVLIFILIATMRTHKKINALHEEVKRKKT